MKKIIYIIILFAILFPACKKYSDGPLFSFRSAKNRVIGTWKVDKLYIDNIDSTDEYFQKLGYEIEFTKQLHKNIDTRYVIKLNSYDNGHSYWYFKDGAKRITIVVLNSSINAIGPVWQGGTWTINRLTNKEFTISITPENNFTWNKPEGTTYMLKLKK